MHGAGSGPWVYDGWDEAFLVEVPGLGHRGLVRAPEVPQAVADYLVRA